MEQIILGLSKKLNKKEDVRIKGEFTKDAAFLTVLQGNKFKFSIICDKNECLRMKEVDLSRKLNSLGFKTQICICK